ncbi:MAG: peptidoglycan DD-metalloendopeptidase family protein [Hyphomicrobiaceae bacterium]|nr:peptidoglycan DD-metalloendopeptidase family protein [Hyphomicrobiaceae bacterium]MCC0007104.1 peptidoglycan DD-metalloendopeptidase family protein [Hyphomicrobiaceae bacterium]
MCSVGALVLAGLGPPLLDAALSPRWAGSASPMVLAAMAQSADPAETRRRLEQQESELKSARDREQTLAKDVADIDLERERLKERLVETAALIQKSESRMSSIEGRLGELEAQEKIVRGSLNQRHGQIAKLLGALQRMGRNPPPVLVTRRSDALEMVRSAMLLSAAFPELRGQALQLSGRLKELVRVLDEIRSESQRLKAETDRLTEAQTKLAGLMEERKKSLDQRRSELADVRRASAEISRSVTDLNELIARLDSAVTQNTELGKYQKEIAAAPAAPQPPPAATTAPSGPIVVVPDAAPAATAQGGAKPTEVALNVPKPGEIVELRPSHAGPGAATAARMKPAIPFHKTRGRLPLPAAGRTVLKFGEKTQYGGNSKGIVLETRTGAQITSPCDGWVVYAGEFRSYGQLLIINAGGGYHILLAGLSRIDVEPGQFVLAAEPVGTMSGTASTRELKSDNNAPVLYVEFRKEGTPIDPNPWWVSGPEKVQG